MVTETTTFEIKTHEHEFTEKYVYLRRQLEQEAGVPERFRSYVTEDDLKSLQNYRETSNTFYPENHWYAFQGDELIGYAHLWPIYDADGNAGEAALTDIPGSKDQNPEVVEALKQAIADQAKSLGVKTLQITVDEEYELKVTKIQEYGFVKGEVNQYQAQIPLDKLNFGTPEGVEVTDFQEENHMEDIIAAYETVGITRDFIENQTKNIREAGSAVSWLVSHEDGKLTGHSLAIRSGPEAPGGQATLITRGVDISDEQYSRAIRAIYTQHGKKAKEAGMEHLSVYVNGTRLPTVKYYEDVGIAFKARYAYDQTVENFTS